VRYFAYGSNMDPAQMEGRCPGAVPLGPARLPGYRIFFRWDSPGWGGGVADVQETTGHEVWGVLWDLLPGHEDSLDDYEAVAEGVYGKREVTVEASDGPRGAYLYIMAPDRAEKPPSQRYLRVLIRGARAHGLPEAYVQELRALLPDRAGSPS